MKILDVGCGKNKRKGAIGVDLEDCPEVDIVHNLDLFPWPLKENEFDLIICSHILEHLNNIVKTMEEIHRIAKNKGKVIIRTPHFSNVASFTDPLHKQHFSLESFNYFIEGTKARKYTKKRFRLVRKRLTFGSSQIIGKFLAIISTHFYEKYLCFIFPAQDIYLELEVIK